MSPQRRKPAGFRIWTAALALAATISAQEPASTGFEEPSGQFYSQEATAYALALGGTVLPVLAGIYLLEHQTPGADFVPITGAVLMASGLLVGPSLGQFYAGKPGVGTGILGAVGRGIGGLLFVTGIAEAVDDLFCGSDTFSGNECDGNDGSGQIVAGIVLYSASAVFSLVDTHFAMRRKWRLSEKAGLAPTLRLARSGEPAAGAAAWLRF